MNTSPKDPSLRVGLFVTCLVDLFRPSVGFAAVKLLEAAGCNVEVPYKQTCCGQPAHNSGDRSSSRSIARQVIKAFEDFDAVAYLTLELVDPRPIGGALFRRDLAQVSHQSWNLSLLAKKADPQRLDGRFVGGA